jgi:hypothetical protein
MIVAITSLVIVACLCFCFVSFRRFLMPSIATVSINIVLFLVLARIIKGSQEEAMNQIRTTKNNPK